jgi:hypothetical protein
MTISRVNLKNTFEGSMMGSIPPSDESAMPQTTPPSTNDMSELGWTPDTLKEHLEAKIAALHEIDKVRSEHAKELRAQDEQARLLAREAMDAHFLLLNENAKRTIEERSHFVSQEAYEPFRERVSDELSLRQGHTSGTASVAYWLIAVTGILIGLGGLLYGLLRVR